MPIPIYRDEYWTAERISKSRLEHIERLKESGKAFTIDEKFTKQAIAEAWSKWEHDDHIRARYAMYLSDKKRFNMHPCFNDWLSESEAAWHDASAPVPPLFEQWLMLDKNLPRIRGDNPPRENVQRAADLVDKAESFCSWVVIPTIAIVGMFLFYGIWDNEPALFVVGLLAGAGAAWFEYPIYKGIVNQAAQLNQPLTPHVYNTEYHAPLADSSVVKTNIFFTLPLSHSNKDQQLNTVTEKEFLIFVGTKSSPPTGEELQDHLAKKLLSFQDENQIPFLRVEVSLHIHIPSAKPKGGGTVSV